MGQGVGALKRGAGTPLQTMLYLIISQSLEFQLKKKKKGADFVVNKETMLFCLIGY